MLATFKSYSAASNFLALLLFPTLCTRLTLCSPEPSYCKNSAISLNDKTLLRLLQHQGSLHLPPLYLTQTLWCHFSQLDRLILCWDYGFSEALACLAIVNAIVTSHHQSRHRSWRRPFLRLRHRLPSLCPSIIILVPWYYVSLSAEYQEEWIVLLVAIVCKFPLLCQSCFCGPYRI